MSVKFLASTENVRGSPKGPSGRIHFRNETNEPVDIYQLDPGTSNAYLGKLFPGGTAFFWSRPGTAFSVEGATVSFKLIHESVNVRDTVVISKVPRYEVVKETIKQGWSSMLFVFHHGYITLTS